MEAKMDLRMLRRANAATIAAQLMAGCFSGSERQRHRSAAVLRAQLEGRRHGDWELDVAHRVGTSAAAMLEASMPPMTTKDMFQQYANR